MINTGIVIKHAGENITLYETRFSVNGALAIVAQCESGEPYARVSTNLDRPLNLDEFVMSHNLDDEFLLALYETGRFKRVGMANYGFTQSDVVRFIRKDVENRGMIHGNRN